MREGERGRGGGIPETHLQMKSLKSSDQSSGWCRVGGGFLLGEEMEKINGKIRCDGMGFTPATPENKRPRRRMEPRSEILTTQRVSAASPALTRLLYDKSQQPEHHVLKASSSPCKEKKPLNVTGCQSFATTGLICCNSPLCFKCLFYKASGK